MKNKLGLVLLGLLWLGLFCPVYGQNIDKFKLASASINDHFHTQLRPTDSLSGKLDLGIHNFNYFRNYEYSNLFHDGYTLYGSQLETQLHYYAHPNLLISAGVYARKDFGQQGLHDVLPLFKLTYSKNDLNLIFGQIEGNTTHGYIEPIQNLESRITNPVQYGTQIKIDKPSYKLDAWAVWQKMIYPRDSLKEEILGGFLFETLLYKQGRHQLSFPVQFQAFHRGGQIDLLKEVPLSTLTNTALGFKYQVLMPGRIQKLFTENYAVFYHDFSPKKQLAYSSGTGLYVNMGLQATWGHLKLSYWNANSYMSLQGMPLYQSYSNTVHDSGHREKKRELFLLQYVYQKELIPNFYLDLRFEPFFDLNNSSKNLQFHHSLFLSYRTNFSLLKK